MLSMDKLASNKPAVVFYSRAIAARLLKMVLSAHYVLVISQCNWDSSSEIHFIYVELCF